MHNFTSNDLLLYVLNEANSDTTLAIEKAMQTNLSIKNEIKTLKMTIDEVDQFEMQPDAKLMDFIMEDLFVEERKVAIV
ncbi:MAG: hypothetical protein IPK62_05685 [Bacteroidetes bacterium]|nr:hypothetical protein [Bacteroidota bacterium]MBK8144510.1 hypothetical protein [Bacteroidota bacterium]MBP6315537.1 hypothetical protein [Chitinophagaceae bacterium]